MSPGGRIEPNDALTAARFSLTIDGVEVAQFAELVQITSGIDPSALTLGLDPKKRQTLKKLPGKRVPPTVVLRRSQTNDLSIFAWHSAALAGDVGARKPTSLVMFNTTGEPVARYHLEHAWPAKIEIGALKAGASQILLETVTLVCEDLQRVSV